MLKSKIDFIQKGVIKKFGIDCVIKEPGVYQLVADENIRVINTGALIMMICGENLELFNKHAWDGTELFTKPDEVVSMQFSN